MNYARHLIALIEDDRVLSDAIYTGLTDAGFTVERAFDGESGLAMVLSKKPSLVLLDILMPKMDGLAVAEKIKNNPETKKIPIIILTVLENAKPVAKALDLGVHEYFIKSDFKVDDIVNRVKEHFNESN
ncbi:MAG: response regulator transcription factor [Parcubacteria group bacterium]|nr:response regulator transcription factor [Parcubacteria group bacterium]